MSHFVPQVYEYSFLNAVKIFKKACKQAFFSCFPNFFILTPIASSDSHYIKQVQMQRISTVHLDNSIQEWPR